MAVVLVVDDEVRIRDLVRRYLEHDGHQVLTAGSGAEALAVAGHTAVDLIVLDLRLPDVSGEEVAAEIRSRSDVPILMLTAKVDERDRIHGLEVGAAADNAATEPALDMDICDLADLAAGAADTLQPLIDAHRHRLLRRLDHATVAGDRARLVQIVTNLLTNAIKFTPDGGTIELAVRRDSHRQVALLTVIDNGPGISPADRPHVFERFYRTEDARSIAGSGIGLAVVDQLVKAHGGAVEVADTATGTKIVVTLPSRPIGSI